MVPEQSSGSLESWLSEVAGQARRAVVMAVRGWREGKGHRLEAKSRNCAEVTADHPHGV